MRYVSVAVLVLLCVLCSDLAAKSPYAGVVVVCTENCGPCIRMKRVVTELQEDGYDAVAVMDDGTYDCHAYPTSVFFDLGGREAGRAVGYIDYKTMTKLLQRPKSDKDE